MVLTATPRLGAMQLETSYLRLRTPVTRGSSFGLWKVCWLGGWTRDNGCTHHRTHPTL